MGERFRGREGERERMLGGEIKRERGLGKEGERGGDRKRGRDREG